MVKQYAKKTIIIGIDTYHDTDRKGKNITGVVSSLNQNCDQWFSQIVMQSSKELYKFIFRLNSAYFHFSTRNATDTFRNRFL